MIEETLMMKIKWLKENDGYIYLNKQVISEYHLSKGQQVVLHFGLLEVKKTLQEDNTLNHNELGVHPFLTEEISMPNDTLYNVKIVENNVYLGPLISMVLSNKANRITPEFLNLLKERLRYYENVKGVIFVSALELIDWKRKIFSGYYFTTGGEWTEGIFPFPNAIYNRTYFKKNRFTELRNEMGVHIFNNCRMTKGKLWRLLSKTDVKEYLPHTMRLTGSKSFIGMMKIYPSVYLKPTDLSKGNGIYKAIRKDEGYVIINNKQESTILKHKRQLARFLKGLIRKRRYLIQQDVSYKEPNERVADFRVYLQKDSTKEWNCSGFICRVSKPGSIVSNLKYTESVIPFRKAARTIFDFHEVETLTLEKEIIQLSKKVCQVLEKKGQVIGDVALDIVLDSNKRIWLLEVQINYGVDERLYQLLSDGSYKKVWTTPIEYAKALSGY